MAPKPPTRPRAGSDGGSKRPPFRNHIKIEYNDADLFAPIPRNTARGGEDKRRRNGPSEPSRGIRKAKRSNKQIKLLGATCDRVAMMELLVPAPEPGAAKLPTIAELLRDHAKPATAASKPATAASKTVAKPATVAKPSTVAKHVTAAKPATVAKPPGTSLAGTTAKSAMTAVMRNNKPLVTSTAVEPKLPVMTETEKPKSTAVEPKLPVMAETEKPKPVATINPMITSVTAIEPAATTDPATLTELGDAAEEASTPQQQELITGTHVQEPSRRVTSCVVHSQDGELFKFTLLVEHLKKLSLQPSGDQDE